MLGGGIDLLGVCYYPEHWPETRWSVDAAKMADAGIRFVRIGEFAWSRLEPAREQFDWNWLDKALEAFQLAGLQVVLGTPTAAAPRWLVDQRPDILAWDSDGQPRRFGSRRHYCFSSLSWREETARICLRLARRYGDHPAIVGWQLDNEYGCHDTVLSYAPHCRSAFQVWLARRHGTIARLNDAWGTVFWGQHYTDFNQVGLPHQTVTEANPSHRLDFQRFSSDQVIDYNRMQAEIIRQHSPERFVSHNAMGFSHDFDHAALASDLDVITWDSYPLGFTDQCMNLAPEAKAGMATTGHPDVAAFHHDLYRGTKSNGRFWVMEQQPGPVNWADHNPIPAKGMVRLWTMEAFAHGAEVVSYFRWRQAPFAQEQMHAGLLRSDGEETAAFDELGQVKEELAQLALDSETTRPSKLAILMEDEAHWVCEIQPQGAEFRLQELHVAFYTACRRLGQDVDILRPTSDFSDYDLVLIPCLPMISEALEEALSSFKGRVIVGPRSGSKTDDFQIPGALAPGRLQTWMPFKVAQVASLPPEAGTSLIWEDKAYPVRVWREDIQCDLDPVATFADGGGAVFRFGNWHYLGFWPDETFLVDYIKASLAESGAEIQYLPASVRLRRRGNLAFAFNASLEPEKTPAPEGTSFLLGGGTLEPCGVAVWKVGGL